MESILLDADVGDDNDYQEDTNVDEFNPLVNTQKNYRRNNFLVRHMGRMSFRRRNQRSSYGVGGDIRPGR